MQQQTNEGASADVWKEFEAQLRAASKPGYEATYYSRHIAPKPTSVYKASSPNVQGGTYHSINPANVQGYGTVSTPDLSSYSALRIDGFTHQQALNKMNGVYPLDPVYGDRPPEEYLQCFFGKTIEDFQAQLDEEKRVRRLERLASGTTQGYQRQRNFSDEDIRDAKYLHDSGISWAAIARKHSTTPAAIRMRVHRQFSAQ